MLLGLPVARSTSGRAARGWIICTLAVTLCTGIPAAIADPDDGSGRTWHRASEYGAARRGNAALGTRTSDPVTTAAKTTATFFFDTSDSRFDPGVDNQGWWSVGKRNFDGNDNYIAGSCCRATFRDFFTFDLSSLAGTPTAATLKVRRYVVRGDAIETLGLFDVTTGARRLNHNKGVSPEIFADLGSGDSYGTFNVPNEGSRRDIVSMALAPTALDDIEAAAGGFFSIGGALLSDSGRQFVFGGSRGRGMQRLVVKVSCVVGTSGPDVLMGTPSADCISGLGGNDTIVARGGNDLVFGGEGNDDVDLGAGEDRLRAGSGADVVVAGRGVDTLTAGAGKDYFAGGRDADLIKGGQLHDILVGRQGADRIFGRAGRDVLRGGRGKDELDGGDNADWCLGGPGDDFMRHCEHTFLAAEGARLMQRARTLSLSFE